jgi:hypothetical protein
MRLREPCQGRQIRKLDTLGQVGLQMVDDAPKLPRRKATAVGSRRRRIGLRWIGQEPRHDRSGQSITIELRRWIGVVHRVGQQLDQGPDAVVGKAQPRRGDRAGVDVRLQALAERRKIERQHRVLHEARVVAMAPHLHAGRGEVHVSGGVADGARLVGAQPRLTRTADLLQQRDEAGLLLVAELVGDQAGAMPFGDLHTHAVPRPLRYGEAENVFGQRRHSVREDIHE